MSALIVLPPVQAPTAPDHPPIECIGGPLDGDTSDVPPGCDAFDHFGHMYRLDREDTGAPFWRYVGYCLVGGA